MTRQVRSRTLGRENARVRNRHTRCTRSDPMIRELEHEGHAAIELSDARTRTIVVHDVGPRIAWFGPRRGDNLLFWDRAEAHTRGAWRLHGGHRLWVTRPGADESEETYAADERPCTVRVRGDRVTVAAPPDPQRLIRSMTIRPIAGGVAIDHAITNAGDMLWAGGAWALTCTRPRAGTRYGVPLGAPEPWDVVTIAIPRTWGGGHTSRADDPQIRVREHAIVLRPRGVETKRMIRAAPGVIGMTDPRAGVSLIVRAAFDRDAQYPLASNLAFYVGPGNFMVELETMSGQRTLRPGETLIHRETWTLARPIDWDDPASVARLP